MMESTAFSYSTVEIANSFRGESAVFAIDYRSNATVKLTGNKKITFRDSLFSRFRDMVESAGNNNRLWKIPTLHQKSRKYGMI